jgi:hypothetical protein
MIVDSSDDPNLFAQIRQKMDAGAHQGSSWFDPISNRAEAEAYEVLTAKEFYDYLLGKRGDPRSGEKDVWQGFETDTLIQNGLPEAPSASQLHQEQLPDAEALLFGGSHDMGNAGAFSYNPDRIAKRWQEKRARDAEIDEQLKIDRLVGFFTEARSGFPKWAIKFHPDKADTPEQETRFTKIFQAVNNAYEDGDEERLKELERKLANSSDEVGMEDEDDGSEARPYTDAEIIDDEDSEGDFEKTQKYKDLKQDFIDKYADILGDDFDYDTLQNMSMDQINQIAQRLLDDDKSRHPESHSGTGNPEKTPLDHHNDALAKDGTYSRRAKSTSNENTIDPKKIARMIMEDPDEINPLDNTRDEFGSPCDVCGKGLGESSDYKSCDSCSAKICSDCTYHHAHWDLEDLQRQYYNTDTWHIDDVAVSCPGCID